MAVADNDVMARAGRLGAFQLVERIGAGGVGTVWRARHLGPGEGAAVAVKVLSSPRARAPGFAPSMAREVAALAALDHPQIVDVLDHGVVTAEEADPDRRLDEGSPYIVMELGRHGTLEDVRRDLRWPELRVILGDLLKAVGHAHARGLIHRDIKPANVLLDAAGGAKLTDFGLAHVLERADDETDRIAGTPLYMSPEQALGRWRDHGPWTDLYAIGVIAWTVATGRPPFVRKGDVEWILRSHVRRPLPEFWSLWAVPDGFAEWLKRLLEKVPRARYQRAADALWALEQLTDPPSGSSTTRPTLADAHSGPISGPAGANLAVLSAVTVVGDAPATASWSRDGLDVDDGAIDDVPPTRPWTRPPDETIARPGLRSAGEALVGMRRLPLVGRLEERRRLWEALRRARKARRPQVVALRGRAGFGKSRLSRWLCEEAHEQGAATPLYALHGPGGGPAYGLGPRLARHFHCLGVGRFAVEARLELLLEHRRHPAPPDEARALSAMIVPELQPDVGSLHFVAPEEEYALVERVLDALLFERPAVLWLDDVHHGAEALMLVEYLLRDGAPDRALTIVLTVRDDLLPGRPTEDAVLNGIARKHAIETIEVGPIADDHRRRLVENLLGLDTGVAARIVERTAGNPLFAGQLVEDWVARGVLVPGEGGYRVADGAEADLPDDLRTLWAPRLGRALEGRTDDERIALELAATLGLEVSDAEWASVCGEAGVEPAPDLVQRLVRHDLAAWQPDRQGWSFVHQMLREAVSAGAAEAGRQTDHHRACARVLAGTTDAGTQARLARHLVAAGELEAALSPLRSAIEARAARGGYRIAAALLDDYRRCLVRLGAPANDPRVFWVRRYEVGVARADGDLERALALGRTLLADTEAAGDDVSAADALHAVAVVREHTGDLEGAERDLERLLAVLPRLDGDQRPRRAKAILHLGRGQWKRGWPADAEATVSQARDLFDELGDVQGVTKCLAQLSSIIRQQGRLDEAADMARRCLSMTRVHGFRDQAVAAWNVLGEVCRLQGDLDEAASAYRRGLQICSALGSRYGFAPELNLGTVLVEAGRYVEARQQLVLTLERAVRVRMRGTEIGALLTLLPCDAALGAWDDWEEHFRMASRLMEETGFIEADCPRLLALAGTLARDAGAEFRARRVWLLAMAQYRELGDLDAAEAVRRELRALSDAG